MKIILASQSPRRKKLLEQLGLDFDVVPSNCDEKSVRENEPSTLVKKLAVLKASSVASTLGGGHLVIAADTEVVFSGKVIGKPKDRGDALRMLRIFSGKKHDVYTGICVMNTSNGKLLEGVEHSIVHFRSLAEDEISMYASMDMALGCAGAYAVQSEPSPVAGVEGSYTNVVGLPTEKLLPMLMENGIRIQPKLNAVKFPTGL